MERFYKLAMPSGWDFYTGKTINYRDNIGKTVKPPSPCKEKGLCSSGLIHASKNINDCFVGAKIPCSAYIVEGIPVDSDSKKGGFLELAVLEEIQDLDNAFGWRYSEAINPINPFKIDAHLEEKHKALLVQWASIRASIWASIRDSIRASIRDSIWASIWDSIWDSIWALIWDSIRASIWDSIWAYVGNILSDVVTKWEHIDHKEGVYPFQSAVDLWKDGFVASFDGQKWRLHAGPKAYIVYEY